MKKEFYIAGVQHRPEKGLVDGLAEGVILELKPEPTNKFDPNAVMIVFEDEDKAVSLGYVPAKFSAEVAAGLEIGELSCEITEYNSENKPWERIKVCIESIEEGDQYA